VLTNLQYTHTQRDSPKTEFLGHHGAEAEKNYYYLIKTTITTDVLKFNVQFSWKYLLSVLSSLQIHCNCGSIQHSRRAYHANLV